ncbi:uncharacterized protein LOC113744833 isoform X2 [Larimichthys crocea]|uniref:uncharacterized protein LOC113744833 isoform X2 n=1 Tax=Larimichthys crocea TaxID=215358 RepID=UPI000F5D5F9D|nr:uncharacterized protein LOC113744833 isoform X2 [Larimichthys crocea]
MLNQPFSEEMEQEYSRRDNFEMLTFQPLNQPFSEEMEQEYSRRNNFEMVTFQPLNQPFSEEMEQDLLRNNFEMVIRDSPNQPFSEEMEQQDSRRNNIEMVTRESLMPILSAYFETVTEAQWNLLSAGILSSNLEKTLSEMITCIVNSLCKDLFLATLKTCRQRGNLDQNELEEVVDLFNLQIEETLPSSFAEVLNVPAEECLEDLTYPVQQEVAQKFVSLVELAADEKDIEDINIPISTLPQMILIVTTYLKKAVAKLKPCCLRLCCSPGSRKSKGSDGWEGSCQSDDDPAPNLTDSLDDILAQQCLRPDLVERETSSDLSYHSSRTQTPCGDIARLLQSVKDFFTRPDLTTEKTGFAAFQERLFCNFADKKFVHLIEDIKSAIRQTGRVASLSPDISDDDNEEMMDENGSDTVKPATSGQSVQEKINSEIRIFSKDLVNKIYGHVMAGHTYKIPMTGMRRSLSDSVIYRVRRLEDATLHECSPEALYGITEHFMVKFLHDLNIFWIDDNVRHEDAVSELSQFRATQTPRISPLKPIDSLMSEEEDDSVSLPVTSSLTNTIVSLLLVKIIKRAPRKMKRLVENMDISSIINRLSEALMGEISNPVSVRQMKKLNKAVIKGLIKDFGSEKKMLAALVSNDRSFDAAVVKQFKIQQNRPTQKSPVSRFFSALGKIAMGCMCSSGCCSDD